MKPLFPPDAFHIADGVSHVCAGGETAPLRSHEHAMQQYLADKSAGPRGRIHQEQQVETARASIARLWGVNAGDIGFVSNVAEGMSIVAESLRWQPGDAIAFDANEYPSMVAPLAFRRDPSLRLIQARGGEPDRLLRAAEPGTRIILASYVSFLTGERTDLRALRARADAIGALLVVDFTQASGYLPIEASLADFAFSACYKWMLGITGTAIAYWNRQRQPDWAPASAGWYSLAPGRYGFEPMPALRADAMRFTRGNPAHIAVYVLNSALTFLSHYDMAAVQTHVQTLTQALHEALAARQYAITTPADPARHGASVCFTTPDAPSVVERLYDRNVYVWNGQGRVRVSFHGYNTLDDVDRVIAALA
jgi:selenocysteine lyase/cysteine desulfurase